MSHAFTYDPFQQQAIACVDEGVSVLVAAPTGAGKTAIAEYAIEHALARGQSVVYTAPIKALSNQKYRDFYARYGDRIGILTGDVTLNADAPVLIMTTEIYRNSLLEGEQRFAQCAWVIFDEVHYLDDPDRGRDELLQTAPVVPPAALLSHDEPDRALVGGADAVDEPRRDLEEEVRLVPLARPVVELGGLDEPGERALESGSGRDRGKGERAPVPRRVGERRLELPEQVGERRGRDEAEDRRLEGTDAAGLREDLLRVGDAEGAPEGAAGAGGRDDQRAERGAVPDLVDADREGHEGRLYRRRPRYSSGTTRTQTSRLFLTRWMPASAIVSSVFEMRRGAANSFRATGMARPPTTSWTLSALAATKPNCPVCWRWKNSSAHA